MASLKSAAPFLLAALCLSAQPAQADVNDAQAWFNLTYTGHISEHWMAWAEVQGRFGENAGRLSQGIVRPGIGYELQKGLTIWAGYLHQDTISAASRTEEHRFWQQISWVPGQIFGGTVSSRTRLEQRLLSNGDDTGWRFRQMLRYEQPLFAGSDMSAIMTSEIFMAFNDTDWGARSGFDQARNFIGIGFTAFPDARLEVGYLNQYIERPGPSDRINHILSVSLSGRF